MRTKLFNISALLMAALLAGCGGGSGDSSQNFSQGQSAQASMHDCFILTPGVRFTLTDGTRWLNVQEQFEGQTYTGAVELRANNTRFGATYSALSNDYFEFLISVDYDINGAYSHKYVYSNYRIPLNMTPGSSVTINGTETEVNALGVQQPADPFTETFTFLGFEDLTLAGRSFPNTCKLREDTGIGGNKPVYWIAKGFGVIKEEIRDPQGTLVSSTEIETIVSAPTP